MVVVPEFLIKRIYQKGSLKKLHDGASVVLKNVLGPGFISGFNYVEINGVRYEPQDVKFITNGQELLGTEVSEANPIAFRLGQSGELVMVLQNAQTLSNAIKLLEADFTHRLVNYNDNDVDKWCLKNACLKVNDLGQCLIIKAEPSKRIDGAVCKAILYEMYRQNRTEWRQMINAI